MKLSRYFILLLIFFCITCLLVAQDEKQASTSTNERIALVIGNSDYDMGPLLNPVNDAHAMADALRGTGFEVFEHLNLETMADMKRAIREFGRQIQNGGVGLFYYAGHGIQVGGRNYLIPTKAEIFAEEEVEYEAVDMGFVLAQMEIARNRMNILILDACRNNPFARSWRSTSTGLAFVNAPAGTLIAYATAPGSVASDGTGANGLYTEELLKQIGQPGLKIEDVFKNVRSGVIARSSNRQTPWESSSLVGDFYFRRPEAVNVETDLDEMIPERIGSGGMTTWRRSGEGYRFLQSGVDISFETSSSTIGRDALLYDPTTNRNYLLGHYWDIKDTEFRDAVELVSRENAFWLRKEDMNFRFYYEGTELTTILNNDWYKDELIVYITGKRRYFLLQNFENAEKDRLFKARPIYSSNGTLWWGDGIYYHLYIEGDQVGEKTYWQWSGNDLIVNYEEGQSAFRLQEFYMNSDEVPRPAEIIVSPGTITWKKDTNNSYWLYRNGVPFDSLDIINEYCGNDVVAFDGHSQQDFLLENYLDLEAGTDHPVRSLWSRNHAYWIRSEDSYRLFVKGELISGRTTAENAGRNLEVADPETGNVWVLTGYYSQEVSELRTAVLKE